MNFLQPILDFFRRFLSLFSTQRPPGTGDDRYLTIYLYSTRCREPLFAKVDRMNEISIAEISETDGEEGETRLLPDGAEWYVRKVVHTSGEKRCFAEVEVELWLDKRKQVIHHEVRGGRWLEEHEYNALIDEELARIAAEEEAVEEETTEEEAAEQAKQSAGETEANETN